MHRQTEFVLVVLVAAVAICALAFLTFFLAGGPTGAVVGDVGSDASAGWLVTVFAGIFLVGVCATAVYHYWHHRE